MKKHAKKHSNIPSYIGHNNPPKDIEPIEFTNSAILGIKVDELNFGNKIYLEIPFIVPKGSHLKGLLLTISKLTKRKIFTLRFYLSDKLYRHHLGDFKPYKSSNNPGFTCAHVNTKQYEIYKEQKAKRINVNLENTKIKNYGGMIRGLGTPENSQVFVRPLREREPECKSFFIGRVACDHTETGEWEDAAVEFTPQDLDQHDRNKPFEERTSFSSKVEESIYRAKLDLLRKKGGWD